MSRTSKPSIPPSHPFHAACVQTLGAALMGVALTLACAQIRAQTVAAVAPAGAPTPTLAGGNANNPVVASGTVPDEATRAAVLARLREVYGADRVVDQLSLGSVVAPPQWTQYVQKLLGDSLKQVSHGRLQIQGNTIEIQGEVPSEALRQQVINQIAQALNPTYTVRNGLRVAVQEQSLMDQTLANRIVEFEPGSAVLRPVALPVLDDMARAMLQLQGKRFEVIGHTDASGARAGNVALSMARAQAVKAYLVGKGVTAQVVSTLGMGPDQPVAPNDSDEGRARNRRIEFRVGG
jgi:OOP family OmpA-OmpF porin